MRRLALVLFLVVAGCNGPSYRVTLGLSEGSVSFPASFRLGDTIQVYASEWEQRFLEAEEPTATSRTRPAEFTWESSHPGIVQVISPGRIVMKGAGTASLSVSGPRASSVTRIVVFPAGSAIRIVQGDRTVNVGETLTLEVAAVDPQGIEFARLRYPEVMASLVSTNRLPYDPILLLGQGVTIQMRAAKAGTDSVVAVATIYRGPTLRDTITVVVR